MKTIGFVVGICLTWSLSAQKLDSIVIQQKLDSLIQLSKDYINNQQFDKASALNESNTKIALENFGKNSISYGWCIFIKGKLNYYQGDFKETEKCYLEYSAILESIYGEDNSDFGWSLNDLGQLYTSMGQFEKGESMHLKSKKIFEKIRGIHHPDYAWCLNDLAILYRTMGAYEKAEPLYLEAKSIREKALGKKHPDYAWSLNNLANLYTFMGSYEKAEPYLQAAISIWENLYDKESVFYATGLNNQGALYINMGALKKAENLFLESSVIRGKILGKDNLEYAGSINNLAGVYFNLGEFKKAEPLYFESRMILEKTYGKEHAEFANNSGNLGSLYSSIGNFEKAEIYFLEAKSIWEKIVGTAHPEFAISLSSLANHYFKIGQFQNAEPMYLKALEIFKKSLGTEHPNYSECLRNIVQLYLIKGRIKEAIVLLEEISVQEKIQLAKATSFLSERELSEYINTFQNQADDLCTYFYTCPRTTNCSHTESLTKLAYDRALFYKGFLLTAAVRLKALSSSTDESREIYNRLKSYHRRLASEYSLPIGERTIINELEEKANATEKELAQIVSGYSDAVRQIRWQDVQKSLKKNEAAIEFVHFNLDFPNATDSLMYVALLLRQDASHPILISLFEEKTIDSLLHSNSERKADYVNDLYTLENRGAVEEESAKRSLYEILWKPLEKELSDIKTIYFSPSGLLHRINFNAIPIAIGISETETLADKYQLIELNSTRQLVIPTQIKITNHHAILYGGIQFEQDSTLDNNGPLLASRSRGELSFSNADTTMRGGSWKYLAGTEREVNAIEKILDSSGIRVESRKGYEATEESFKNIGANNISSPRILHLATHGYFFADSKEKVDSKESVFKTNEHPMLRSGLIMAGGNVAWQGKQTLEGREDGILTAYEISQMNLSNTELVVLSACETGLGDIQGNEGVYGLQRAFKIAGAKYLIMSLWQVPDKQTSLLMTTFYKKWLEAEGPENGANKISIPDAFHAAQKELREIGLDPYQWAGFVLVE